MLGGSPVQCSLRGFGVEIAGGAGLRGGHPVIAGMLGHLVDADGARRRALGAAGFCARHIPAAQHHADAAVRDPIGRGTIQQHRTDRMSGSRGMPELMSDGLFDVPGAGDSADWQGRGRGVPAPLAVRMRPESLDEVVGQLHLLTPNSPLRRLVEGSGAASVILYGPPGTGKTTLASLISQATARRFEALSAVSAGVKEVRAVIENARRAAAHGEQTVLFIDEVHRFSKTQQDALLAAVENRVVLLVAATTENPSFSVVAPLLSRSLILQLRPLTGDDIRTLIQRAVEDPRGLGGAIPVEPDAVDLLVTLSAGDARRALTALEVAAETVADAGDPVTVESIEQSLDKAAVRYDRDGDQHYDVISAFIKSVRGSDVDAALHYLARMLVAGEDPRFVARRLMILASEDIGMADPTSLQTARSE